MNIERVLFILAFPLLISCQFNFNFLTSSMSLQVNEAVTKDDANFTLRLFGCLMEVNQKDPTEMKQCLTDEGKKTGITNPQDPNVGCCGTTALYKCFKKFMIPVCGFSKDEVEKRDEEIFEFINRQQTNGTQKDACKGNKDDSLKLCHLNGSNKVTWNISLYIFVIFIINLYGFNFKII